MLGKRGFAAAVVPQHRRELPLLYRKVYPAQAFHIVAGIGVMYIFKTNYAHLAAPKIIMPGRLISPSGRSRRRAGKGRFP